MNYTYLKFLPFGKARMGSSLPSGRLGGGLLLLFICSTLSAQSIDINAVLASIEKNNLQLKAKQKSNAAAMADKQTENTLGETSVEYSPFYQRGVAGLASSELIVSQSLDFPTLYSARSKAETLQREVLDKEYLVLRRDIFVEAKKLCYDLVYARENADLIIQRYNAADSLRVICDKRMRHGDATAMEQNRVMMDLMNVRTEMEQNRGDIERLIIQLEHLGADPKLLTSLPTTNLLPFTFYLLPQPSTGGEVSLTQGLWCAKIQLANHDITLAKQEMLPRLTVGYRRNTEVRESLNGFLVGVAMPLFSNSRKVKAARLRKEAIEQERENAIIQQDARRMQLEAEAKNLSNVIDTYDVALMQKTLSTLMRAVKAGQMSIMEYYTESDRVFTLLQNRLSALNQRNKTVAELESL